VKVESEIKECGVVMRKDPYSLNTTYESEFFRFRQVQLEDASDLLFCYGDEKSAALFNSDNCTSDFYYKTPPEMLNCIKFWVSEFKQRGYIRHVIHDKRRDKIIGTVEFFHKRGEFGSLGRVGLLRLDLASPYELKEEIDDILIMIHDNMYRDFEVDTILTKAIPLAFERIDALKGFEYKKFEDRSVIKYSDYFYRKQ